MANLSTFAEVAALAGDPARAGMLNALMDGRALTASELARVAGVTPQTASGHLAASGDGRSAQRREAGPVPLSPHRLARCGADDGKHHAGGGGPRPEAAAPDGRPQRCGLARGADLLRSPCRPPRRGGRGSAGSGYVELAADAGLVTEAGIEFLGRIGIELDAITTGTGRRSARILCRPCLDWSERRPHIAGAIGAALCAHSFAQSWIRRIDGTRAVTITAKGERVFREKFGVRSG